MAKPRTQFICRSCGGVQSRWMGKCPDCGEWDSLEEYRAPAGAGADKDRQRGDAPVATASDAVPQAVPITQVDQTLVTRIATNIGELDRVLGGGEEKGQGPGAKGQGEETETNPKSEIRNPKSLGPRPSALGPSPRGLVPGSVVLVGGDPGIGKSTLLLQAADQLSRQGKRVLYVTSEESAQQTRLRASRLGAASDNLYVLADTNLARIIEQTRQVNPVVVVIDSIQMIYKGDLPAGPGSVTQLRACATELVYLAKATGIAVFLVGHVTKEGTLAGPKLLEHMVDTVLYFEGDRYHSHRIVRAIKNRFGTTLEVGLFEMSDAGLREVRDAGGLLAAEYRAMAGSVICPVMQGTRCLLVEIQALTANSILGSAKRKVSGLDANRLAMLIAVLEKRGGLRLADQDVFASSVGGMKVIEPAADLAIALAIAGAHLNRSLGPISREKGLGPRAKGQGEERRHEGTEARRYEDAEANPQSEIRNPKSLGPRPLAPGPLLTAIGEIGLGGELRHVSGLEQRIREAHRLGFSHVICPPVSMKAPAGCTLIPVATLQQAMEMLS